MLSSPNTLEMGNDSPAALSVASEEIFHLANRKFCSTNQNDNLPKPLWTCARMEVRLSLYICSLWRKVLIVLYYSFLVIGRPVNISGQRGFPFFFLQLGNT